MPPKQETNYDIIVCGERVPLEGLKGDPNYRVINFVDDKSIAFDGPKYQSYLNASAEHRGKKSVWPRRSKKGAPLKVDDIQGVKESVSLVILHADLTRDSLECFKQLAFRGLSTHFMINWDGTIYQGMDVGNVAIHAGEVNGPSIGVDMNNMMRNLRKDSIGWRKMKAEGKATDYLANNGYHPESKAWDGTTYKDLDDKDKRKFNRPKYPRKGGIMRLDNGARVRSFGYTDFQIRALAELMKVLTDKLDIKRQVPFGPDGKVQTSVIDYNEFSGIVGHWHISATRWDPGPGLDWNRLQAMLNNEGNSFPILLRDGENIGSLMDPEKVVAQAKKYFKMNEEGMASEGASIPSGGWFPVGPNQTWHGGILLQKKKGSDVRCMFDGTVVAARMSPGKTRLGSNNFVCVRHKISVPKRNKKKSEDFVFWSLYMHLDYMDIDKLTDEEKPEWMKNLLKLGQDELEDVDDGMSSSKPKDDDDEDEFIEEVDEDEFITKPSKVGVGLSALKSGRIATFDWEETPTVITAGSVVGRVGEFGQPEEWSDQVRIEVFTDDRWKNAVDMAVHSRYFTEVRQRPKDDEAASLFVHHRGLLSLYGADFSRSRQTGSLIKGRVLSSEDIADVYQGADLASDAKKSRLRRLVVRHVSEWSDQVDWIQALSDGEDWRSKTKDFKVLLKKSGMFKDALGTVLPQIWLNKDVAERIGLDFGAAKTWDGQIWHFHPIHFLWWLTYRSSRRVQNFSKKLSYKELKAKRAAEEKANRASEDAPGQGFENRERGFDHFEPVDVSSSGDVDVKGALADFFEDMETMPNEWDSVRGE
jgi:N-acetyl-anhydromuramyl-L-alanine amidase AmpD